MGEYFEITYNPVEKKEVIKLMGADTKVAIRYSSGRVAFGQGDNIIVLDIDELLDVADHVRSQIQAK